MENVQEQTEHARTLERAERFAEAREVYSRLATQPGDHQRDPSFWLRLADLQARLDPSPEVLEHYTRAGDLLERAGQLNGALALCYRALRHFPDDTATHLRLGRLAARLGYSQDARAALAEYARRMEAAGEGAEALAALRSLLSGPPGDAVVREQIARLSGGSAGGAASVSADEDLGAELPALPGLDHGAGGAGHAPPQVEPEELPTLADPAASAASDLGLEPTALGQDHEAALGGGFAPLEGLEPTHGAGDWERPAAPPADRDEPDDLPLMGFPPAEPAPRAPEAAASRSAPSPFGVDEEDTEEEADADEDEDAGIDDLPLLGPPPAADTGTGAQAEAGVEPEARSEPEPEPEPEPESMPEEPASAAADEYVDLGALILSDDEDDASSTRVAAPAIGDGDRDFEEILALFREKINREVDPGDAASHYDLGLAFKEMGLLDDAVAQLQVALKGGANPVATLEVLGECFVEKGDHAVAEQVLTRATRLRGADEADLVGVHYWLGRCYDGLARGEAARAAYERVVALDPTFRDAAERLERLRSGDDRPL